MVCKNCLLYSICQHKSFWDAVKHCEILRYFLNDLHLKHPSAHIFTTDWQQPLKSYLQKEMVIDER